MSTLKVTNLQDTSGGNNSTSAEIFNGRAKAWVNFNAVGTVSIRADFNVSSITDNSAGQFDVNFSNAMSDANYAMGFLLQEDIGGGSRVCAGYGTRTASYMRLETRNNNNANTDMEWNTVCFFR